MSFTTICMIIIGVIELWAVGGLLCYASDLDERELELDKQSVSLDEREQALKDHFLDLARAEDDAKMTVKYCVSESDKIKFSTDGLIERAAKKHMALLIANDILKKYPPTMSVTEDGNTVYTLQITVKQ